MVVNDNLRVEQVALEKSNMSTINLRTVGKQLLGGDSTGFASVIGGIRNSIEEYHTSVSRKRAPFFKLTNSMDNEEVAFIGFKVIFAALAMSPSMSVTLLGSNVGDELLTSGGRVDDVYSLDKNIIKEKVSAGINLLRLVYEGCPDNFFRIDLVKEGGSTTYTLIADRGFEEFTASYGKGLNLLDRRLPMVFTPDPWEDMVGGGYLSEIGKKLCPLVKRSPKHRRPLSDKMFVGLNNIQGTPYRINREIYDLCKELEKIRPLEMKKVFKPNYGKFDKPCPIDREEDAYIWEKEEIPRYGKRGQLLKKPDVQMVYKDDESVAKRRAFFKWTSARDKHRQRKEGKKSLDRAFTAMLTLAEEYLDYDEIYWPMSADRRGRVYPSAMTGINLQGSDFQKAIVEFSRGYPLDADGDPEGAIYSIIKTMTNHWGRDNGKGVKTDKLKPSEAMEWFDLNESWIMRCANSPMDHREWMKASKPLQFLVAAFEWRDWIKYRETHDDYKFVSHLCDPNDASCSGAQILSAITRDPIGCLYTNLSDGDVMDLYLAVADKVTELLCEAFYDDTLAQDWLGRKNLVDAIQAISEGKEQGIFSESVSFILEKLSDGKPVESVFLDHFFEFSDLERLKATLIIRDLVKKPVMVKFYSGTRYGNIDHCKDFIVEQEWESHFREAEKHPASFMGSIIYDSINLVVSGAGKVMDWFVHVADVFSSLDKGVTWFTPVGFPAKIRKHSEEDLRVELPFLDGKVSRFTVKIPRLDKNGNYLVDGMKMKSGIAPDIVHSLDAALIIKVAERCATEGILDLTMIHDSLGCHCAFSRRFNRIIRESFLEIFSGDILGAMYQHWSSLLPEDQKNLLLSPEQFGIVRGDFDLHKILKSIFCFR